MKLVKPSIEFKDSFIEAALDIIAEGLARSLKSFDENMDFQTYCDNLENESKGISLKEDMVPTTTLWLIDSNCFIGRVNIRHILKEHGLKVAGNIGYIIAPKYRRKGYGTKILKLCLPEAKVLGLKRVLVTCDISNVPSARIIEKNGGIFENEILDEETGKWKSRYWIELKG